MMRLENPFMLWSNVQGQKVCQSSERNIAQASAYISYAVMSRCTSNAINSGFSVRPFDAGSWVFPGVCGGF